MKGTTLLALLALYLSSCASTVMDVSNKDEYKNQDISYIPSSFDDAWAWVSINIEYEENYVKKTPEQTYHDRAGDCKDQALLLAYLCYSIGLDVYVSRDVTGHTINYYNGQYIETQAYGYAYETFEEIGRYTYAEAFYKNFD